MVGVDLDIHKGCDNALDSGGLIVGVVVQVRATWLAASGFLIKVHSRDKLLAGQVELACLIPRFSAVP